MGRTVHAMHPQQQYARPPMPPRPKSNTWKWVAAGAVVVLLLVCTVVLAQVAAKVAGGLPKVQATPSAPAEPAGGGIPAPSVEERRVYLKMLEMIDFGLVADADRAVSRGRDVCLDLREGKSDATVWQNARKRFAGDVEVTSKDAKRIVIAVQAWCQL